MSPSGNYKLCKDRDHVCLTKFHPVSSTISSFFVFFFKFLYLFVVNTQDLLTEWIIFEIIIYWIILSIWRIDKYENWPSGNIFPFLSSKLFYIENNYKKNVKI